MLLLRVNGTALKRSMLKKNLSAAELSHRLIIFHHPSARTVTGWVEGEPVSSRWRNAISELFSTDDSIFGKSGNLLPAAQDSYGMTVARLSKVTIKETVTRPGVNAWLDGGGIEPNKLKALAGYLGTAPIDLLERECLDEIQSIIGEGSLVSL